MAPSAQHPRVEQLVRQLGLSPHPEGGAFREIFRSPRRVALDGEARSALTSIYFLLGRGERSRWHRVAHDEVWHFYEGDPLELTWLAADHARLERRTLAACRDGHEPVAVVPAGCWQSARALGNYALVGCTVGPGFEYADFTLLAGDPEAALAARFPEMSEDPDRS